MQLPFNVNRPLEDTPDEIGARWFVVAGVPWWGLAFAISFDAGLPMLVAGFAAIVAGAIPLDEAYRRLPEAPQARISVGGMALGLGVILFGRGGAEAASLVPRLLYGSGAALAVFGVIAGVSGVYRQVTNSDDEEVSA